VAYAVAHAVAHPAAHAGAAMIDAAALRLIAITDDLRDGVAGLVGRAVAAERGGATMVQLRLKALDARELVDVGTALVRALTVPVLVNDRVDVALACGAAGVHVGFDDMPVRAVRRIVPAGFVIGASVGADGEVANGSEADYVGVGPLFTTASKGDAGPAIGPEGVRRLRERCGRPCVAIGGITVENALGAIEAGADGVAVIRSVFGAESPERAARELRRAIGT
jgi:thiamine-phosphate pyrophosphorylase